MTRLIAALILLAGCGSSTTVYVTRDLPVASDGSVEQKRTIRPGEGGLVDAALDKAPVVDQAPGIDKAIDPKDSTGPKADLPKCCASNNPNLLFAELPYPNSKHSISGCGLTITYYSDGVHPCGSCVSGPYLKITLTGTTTELGDIVLCGMPMVQKYYTLPNGVKTLVSVFVSSQWACGADDHIVAEVDIGGVPPTCHL